MSQINSIFGMLCRYGSAVICSLIIEMCACSVSIAKWFNSALLSCVYNHTYFNRDESPNFPLSYKKIKEN